MILRRLVCVRSGVGAFVFAVGLCFSGSSLANKVATSPADAYAQCQYYAANGGHYAGLPVGSPTDCRAAVVPMSDTDVSSRGKNAYALYWCDPRNGNGGCSPSWVWNYFYYDGDPPANPCLSLPTVHLSVDGKVFEGYSFTQNVVDPVTGATVPCAMVFSPTGPPIWDPNRRVWTTYGAASPSGNIAGGTGWTDGNGNAPLGSPPNPPSPPADLPNPPKICSVGSCYDPKSDNFGTDLGGSFSTVSGPGTRSPGGQCTSSGGGSICGGGSPPSGGAPQTIPAPPPSIVPDPATQINSTTRWQFAAPGGASGVTVVNTYSGASGSAPSSGAAPGDSVPPPAGDPAPSGSTSGPGSYGGGGDCNTPPVCTGDAVLCGVASQEWRTMCSAQKSADRAHVDIAGSSSVPAPAATVGQGAVWSDAPAGDPSSVGGQANAGVYNQAGFGAPTACPLHDLSVPLWGGRSFSIPFASGCTPLSWLRYLVIAFALFAAAKITMGGNG